MATLPKLAAVAVVIHQDHVLLVKRKKAPNANLWGFPGGHVEPGETGLDCAVRELLEETGVTATPLQYLTNIDLIRYKEDGALAFHYLLAVVHCQYSHGTPLAADDAAEADWIPVKSILTEATDVIENVQKIVKLVLA